jgi:hypothetical protein
MLSYVRLGHVSSGCTDKMRKYQVRAVYVTLCHVSSGWVR